MQFHIASGESTPPAPASASNALLRGGQTSAAEKEGLDRWSSFDECYREHIARRGLEELFAAGDMWAFEY